MRIGLSCRGLGVAITPLFIFRIRCLEAFLQDRALKLLEGCSVHHAQVRSVTCGGPDGSQLGCVASAVTAHQEVEPDKSPIRPHGVGQLIGGYEARIRN